MRDKLAIIYTIAPEGSPRWKRSQSLEVARLYLDFQIENSLRLGWRRDDILIITNFDQFPAQKLGRYENLGTAAFRGHAGGCLSKHIGAAWALRQHPGCHLWLRDHDCYQLAPLPAPISALLGEDAFLVSGSHPPKLSDQSCFMAPSWLSWLEQFIAEHVNLPCEEGFGFKLGTWLRQPGVPARIVPYALAPWRCNLVSPTWRKEVATLRTQPLVCHQALACPDVAELATQQGHWDFLRLYAEFSAKLKKLHP